MQPHRLFQVLLSLALLAPPPGARAARPADHAQPLQAAYALLGKGDYANAYPAFLRHAEKNPLAQFTLAQFHQNGWGRPADQDAACAWYDKAAQGKIPTALHFAGDCLMRTPDAPGNATAALASYLAAAANGHLISLCSASEFYIRGRYVARDVPHGLALCAQAAQAGSPPAMLKLANYLRQDPDVPHDAALARHWYRMAAERQVDEARYQLAIMQAQGEGGEAEGEAALLALEELAGRGYVPAYLPTAALYAHLPPDADTGAPAAANLAKIYLWASAARSRLNDPALQDQARQLQDQVLAIMPAAWRPALDRKIDAHLAQFAAPGTPPKRASHVSPGA